MKINVGKIYQHIRNQKCYNVIAVGRSTTDITQEFVVYQALYQRESEYAKQIKDYQIWIRPLNEFNEQRFREF